MRLEGLDRAVETRAVAFWRERGGRHRLIVTPDPSTG
jgi:hypothetical protein